MVMNEKFNQIYQAIVNENADYMEQARKEAKVENRHNMIILTVIILINLALNYGFYKITNGISSELSFLFIVLSSLIYVNITYRGGKSKIKKYTIDFKTRIVGTMIKLFEEQLEFSPEHRYIIKCIYDGRVRKI